MTVFGLVAALFLVGALLFLLPPLLAPRAAVVSAEGLNLAVHRDQWQEADADLAAGLVDPAAHEAARRDIQRSMLQDGGAAPAALDGTPARRTAAMLALLLPLASVGLYLQLGRPAALDGSVSSARGEPRDVEGWLVLGRSYLAQGRYRDAAAAVRRAADLSPHNAGLLADLADVTGMAQGKRLAGEPARLIQAALDVDPRHPKALALAGSAAFEAQDYGAARGYWERLLAVLPAEAPLRRSIQGSLRQVAQLEGGAPVAAAGASVSGQVSLSPALVARLAPGDTLFIYARAAQGPRMPLAVIRRPADGQPFDFTLDDSMAMSPELKLSAHAPVVVAARISRSGSATPQSGDLIGSSEAVAAGTRGLRIVIDRVQP